MASHLSGHQEAEFLIETPSQILGTFVDGKNPRFRLPVSCGLASRRSMPAFPSSLTGYNSHIVQWMHSDSWNSEPDSPHFKRPISCTHRHTVSKPLAASHDKSSSSCENSSSVLKISNTRGDVVENSDRGTVSAIWFGPNERKRSSDPSSDRNGNDPMPSKRERGMQGGEGRKFRVVASSRCRSPSLLASDVIGTIDFNLDGTFFATGGIARKIRIRSYEKLIGVDERDSESSNEVSRHEDSPDEDDDHDQRKSFIRRRKDPHVLDHEYAAAGEICTPGKLSSLKWRPDGSDVIGCGDYDGAVMEWNIEHGHTLCEKYEHCGQRVWSLDYSKVTPTLSASSSADGTVRLWSRGVDKSISVIRPGNGNSICSVEFSPVADYLIAVASADARVYLYDLRNSESPLSKLAGHDRAVSYVRFLGKDKLVSASIDSTLKLWDISAPLRDENQEADATGLVAKQHSSFDHGVLQNPVRTFGAHTNVRHFVGLSIHRGASMLACGSETNEVFLYRDSCSQPLLNVRFPGQSPGYYGATGYGGKPYVGAVCWREHGDKYALVAANSEGIVQVLEVDM